MYFNESRNIWIIHCFGECHRNFTAYDYVDLILCLKQQRYKSPMDFLKQNMPEAELKRQLKYCEKYIDSIDVDNFAQKVEYINTTYAQCENIEEYIEELYTK